MATNYIVVCREDTSTDDEFTLATRTVFTDRDAAVTYASGIAASRYACIVSGRFAELRFADGRFEATPLAGAVLPVGARFAVVVGNIGTVYDGSDAAKAISDYIGYLADAKKPYGRASGESVVLFADGEPVRQCCTESGSDCTGEHDR